MARILRFDCYDVDVDAGQIYKRGNRIRLSDQPFRLLAALLEHPGEPVTRDELRRRLWPDEVFVDFEAALNTAVAKVREVLGDPAGNPRFIETLPKHGYRFVAPVSEPHPSPLPVPLRRTRLLVLPFVNATGDAGQEYVSDAMTDEIITELAGLSPETLAVIARTTAMHYKGSHKDVAGIARELSVDYVVEGAVHRARECVTLSVQLIRASDQAHIWARRYDSGLRDAFGLYAAIGQAIGEQLGFFRPGESAKRPRKPTGDLTAYALYQQGRRDFLKSLTAADWAASKRCFEQVIARDPQFALAYDALAELCWYQGFVGFAPPKEVSATGMFYAARALEIDNTLADTHALLAMFKKEIDFDKNEMKRALERARELNPSSPLVKLRYAVAWLMPTGRYREAIAEIQDALESDPLSTLMRAWLGLMFWLDRQYDRAIEQGHLMVEIEPASYWGYYFLGNVTREKGLFDESIAALRTALELSGGLMHVLGWLGLAFGESGKTAEARAVLDRLHEAATRAYVLPTCFVWTYLGLGDTDNAFVWMDRAAEACDHMLTPIQGYPFLDSLRSDPRYDALLHKLKVRPFDRTPAAAER